MLGVIKRLLTKTLYRRLVLGVTVIMALIMALFAWELTRRQDVTERNMRSQQALAMAHGLAANASVWVASRDYSGLQELVVSLSRYPELRYAMVLDTRGQILAHQEPMRRGYYLTDLPAVVAPGTLPSGTGLIDVVSPIMLAKRHVGWARVGLANDVFAAALLQTRREAMLYTLFSMALGAAFAAFAVRYLIRRLHAVQRVADAVPHGKLGLRAEVAGDDEAAQLARRFNTMLDRLAEREEALRQSETLLAETQHMGKIGGWQWNLVQKKLQWTPEIYRIHDLEPGQTELQDLDRIAASAECYPEPYRAEVLAAFWHCVETGTPYDLEVPFTTTKQRPLWVRTTGKAVRQEGKVERVIGYLMDITERKLLEKLNREAALYARTLLEVHHDPLVTISLAGIITDSNTAAEIATGISRNQLIGSDFARYFTDAVAARLAYQQAFADGVVTDYQLAIRHVSGRVMDVNFNATVYHGEDGNVKGVFAAAHDITERKKMEDEIRSLAFFDPLTSLPNRRLVIDRMRLAMANCHRNGACGALIYLDLDNFKPINDTHGHLAGDLLLMEVARRLRDCVREIDTVGRIGGDEFVVILGALESDEVTASTLAGQVAEKIRVALVQPYALTLKHEGLSTHIDHRCAASIGVVVFTGGERSQDDIMKWGDAAMYQAKQAGRNQVHFHVSQKSR